MGSRVLIVDDDFLVADGLESFLLSCGHEVCGKARSADAALYMAKILRPQVVFMDVRLAGSRDGVEAAEMILGEHACRVVFLTAYGDPTMVDRIRTAVPAAAVLNKPTTAADIAAAIDGAG